LSRQQEDSRRYNLAVLIAASVLLDMLWQLFVLFGWERVRIDPGNTRFSPFDFLYFPWSHSLLMSIGWASLYAAVYYGITRYRKGTIVIWFVVLSHWLLDWIAHRSDMPLYPGSARFGLGLWDSVGGTMVVEVLMLCIAVGLYASATRATNRIGRYGFLFYIVVLLGAYSSERFGTLPSDVTQIVWPGIIFEIVMIGSAGLIDRHRGARA
jgi:membrane-bound metal-dependent hydrolase YbcI (DUF457 family)